MNTIVATVRKIDSLERLHLLELESFGQKLVMMSLDLSAQIVEGSRVLLTVKPSHITVTKVSTDYIGDFNQLPATLTAIENGTLLSALKLSFGEAILESVMIADATILMALQVGDEVRLMIAPSALSILEVL